MTEKQFMNINYSYDKKESRLMTVVTFDDDSKMYIYILPDAIFVTECEIDSLDCNDFESYEMYDTTDGCDYYINSPYAEYINMSLIHISHLFLQ